jgi:predicted nucleotidyltransferase component of viral defense system
MQNMFAGEIEKYDISTEWRQQLAATELLQKTIVAGLSETDFFEKVSFHGGTALRLLHGLDRYSLDLDFSLMKKDEKFELNDYMRMVQGKSKYWTP